MRLKIEHVTRYIYPSSVCANHNEVRLMPLTDETQTCMDFWLTTTPLAHVFYYNLPTGRVHHFNVHAPHDELTVKATSVVATYNEDPFAGAPMGLDDSDFYKRSDVKEDYAEYLFATDRVPLDADVRDITSIARHATDAPDTISFLSSVNRTSHRLLAYQPGTTEVDTPIEQVLAARQGVCQDFAHVMLSVCRQAGIPARYVSGYLCTRAKYEQGEDKLSEAAERELMGYGGQAAAAKAKKLRGLVDGEAMHAWVDCLLPNGKWYGFDPTNCIMTNDAYVRVHFGRDYGDVPPLRGVYSGPNATKLEVTVHVTPE